jgi:hypothetical protein
MPTAHSPSIAMTTIVPANSTERPAVAAACTIASSTLSRCASPSRNRVTISSA